MDWKWSATKSYHRLDEDRSVDKSRHKWMKQKGAERLRRRRWRVKLRRRFLWRMRPASKLWRRIKGAYVHMMLGFARNVGSLNGENAFGGKQVVVSRRKSVKQGGKEDYDNRLIYEIYKALIATRGLV